jgi:hypothetical protein
MIVGSKFDGDDDDPTKWLQHDVYGVALSIILDGCRAYARLAMPLTGEDVTLRRFLNLDGVDHRTLQDAHDLAAAWWRFRTGRHYPVLPLVPERDGGKGCQEEWLAGLRTEVASWVYEPWLVRALIVAPSTSGGRDDGEAEDGVLFLLRSRYRQMFEAQGMAFPQAAS